MSIEMNKKPTTNAARKKKSGKPLLIAAIGASAGGIEAMTELLRHISPATGMAFVYIQHLDPTHESMLTAILGRATKMKVLEAKDQMKVEPDKLYIIPPNQDMTIVDGALALNQRKEKPSVHMPVDQFFVSLAERQHELAIGVVLSGNANDGTLGLKAIKTGGGFTFAQDDSAKFKGMPRSAVGEGVVDMVLPPAGIAAELERLAKQSTMLTVMQEHNEDDISNTDEDLVAILQLLKRSTGVDFSHYKMKTIKRRIVRRMVLYKLDSLKEYVQYVRQHAGEINTLYHDLLINVTSFFRDPDAMEYLKKTLLPRLIRNKQPNDPIRIWVPACSTGEEAYSLAMIIMEILGDHSANISVQIFATDLSELAIAKARLGLYSRNEVAEISPKRLQRFFTRVDGSYRIIKSIRDLCVFAPHNIFRDPPFSRLDFISCCNLMIYLDTILQKKILTTFHYALNPTGCLMLGKSETVGALGQLFSQIERKYKIYACKKDASGRPAYDLNYSIGAVERTDNEKIRLPVRKGSDDGALERMVDDVLLSGYVPACVVVNDHLEIVHFRGSTGLFLEPSPGKASLNLLKMARPGLAFELRTAIHKATRSGEVYKKSGIEIKYNGSPRYVSIEAAPLKSEGDDKLFLVTFEETAVASPSDGKTSFSKDKLVKQLQDELHTAKEDMRSIIEEQEASNEELQSANEEIVSSNEELQSINEELETSKEEVESTNEELMTINTELQVRNEQLAEAYDYAEAMFATLREGVLVLDENLRVKSANRAFYRIFHVPEEDVEGVMVYDLGNGQWNIPRLRELLEEVIPGNAEFFGFEVTHTFQHIGRKTMLLNARRVMQKIHRQQLILLAIEDITEPNEQRIAAVEEKKKLANILNNVSVMLWSAGEDKLFNFVNSAWLKFTGRKLEQETGNGWLEGMHGDDADNWQKMYERSFAEKKPFSIRYRFRFHNGNYRLVQNEGRPAFSEEGNFIGFTGSCTVVE
jgi:two-component system, chemotaxis family, CheB/CheR fusion protein